MKKIRIRDKHTGSAALFPTSVPDPDPHVFGPPGPGSFYHQAKIVRKNIDSYCFVTSFGLFIFEK
jgi:hypothetical protein